MAEPLWRWDALVAAAGGVADGAAAAPITGFSIDTRSLQPAEVFVALADQRDGHEFVTAAFAAGAAAAIVRQSYRRQRGDGALLRVGDPLEGLRRIARAARARLSPAARVIAVTGSAGKTTTKEMLRVALAEQGPTHASAKSFNNHWGVPLTLANMPPATHYAVFEIGMNHGGEITPLTMLARPHVAIVLNVLPAHLGHFASVADIAEAKAEIFTGLEPGGCAILNGDSEHAPLLRRRAEAAADHVLAFCASGDCEARLETADSGTGEDPFAPTLVRLTLSGGETLSYRLAIAGRHIAENSAAALLAVREAGGDVGRAASALVGVGAAPGRGERVLLPCCGGEILLIDESYNANPASMAAAIRTAGGARGPRHRRLILALGDMLELGERAVELHRELKTDVNAVNADLVFACGPNMKALFEAIEGSRRGHWGHASKDIEGELLSALRPGDMVMVKGSNGSRMAPLVAAIKAHCTAPNGAGSV